MGAHCSTNDCGEQRGELGAVLTLNPEATYDGAVQASVQASTLSFSSNARWDCAPRRSERASSKDVQDDACCLVWILGTLNNKDAKEEQLARFHKELAGFVQYYNSVILSDDVCSGVIMGRSSGDRMTEEDSLVQLGQMLCRWASREPALSLQVGVDRGKLRCFPLPNSSERMAYFGNSCSGARIMAESSRRNMAVHMSGAVRERLTALRFLPLTISANCKSYYLEHATEVLNGLGDGDQGGEEVAEACPIIGLSPKNESRCDSSEPNVEGGEDENVLSMDDFSKLLAQHGVDIGRFGKGSAKSLNEFYKSVAVEKKSYLVVRNDELERVVELVRISLRFRDSKNKLRELRINSQRNTSGEIRIRNQPLAMVLSTSQQGRWQEAVEKCFEKKFAMTKKAQKACFALDRGAYMYKEERASSDTVPGIITTYKSHNVILTIKDKGKRELQKFGMPDGSDFTTDFGYGNREWTWAPVVDNREEQLSTLLIKGGIDVSEFSWQAFAELYDEVYDKKQSTIEESEAGLVRKVRIIKVWLHVDILNLDHVLVVRSKHQKGLTDSSMQNTVVSMRMSADQEWEEAVEEVLSLRLGISGEAQRSLLVVDSYAPDVTEEIALSRTYPGLKTVYVVHEAKVRVPNPRDRHWHFIGLPGGTDFTFVRQETLKKTGEQDLVITQWGWQLSSKVEQRRDSERREAVASMVCGDFEFVEAEPDPMIRRRVEPPEVLLVHETDELLLSKLMLGRQTDWIRAKRAATRIMDPTYSTKDFYEDISLAFPELRLYCIARSNTKGVRGATEVIQHTTTSDRTADDEFQRTIGALFCIFWLMRSHLDGKECFCFGLDHKFQPRKTWDEADPDVNAEFNKRASFMKACDWSSLARCFIGAGLLKAPGVHDADRTLAMLVLMTIHDIMKLDLLLPTVGRGLVEFGGYKRGEVIMDHDIALSYVLEVCPTALPSFAGLSQEQQDSIRFTHCKLEYNMGWLVQGEAPPAMLFKAFRAVVVSGNFSASDIAFYFVHWFADLAGAEPFPMQGCEKFVLKFPQKVLGSFVDSFPVVWRLGESKTETQVFEEYLIWRWVNHEPSLGAPPTGRGSIAKMRLVLMLQGDSQSLLKEFAGLPEQEQRILSLELAMTGSEDQEFERDPLDNSYSGMGPALLIYYSPALMQHSGRSDPRGALMILAEVFRVARDIWPLDDETASKGVIIRIDALKDLSAMQITNPEPGKSWIMTKNSGVDGQVRMVAATSLADIDWEQNQVLDFSVSRRSKMWKRRSSVGTMLRKIVSG